VITRTSPRSSGLIKAAPPGLRDVLRTVRWATTDVVSEALRMAIDDESTTSAAGLAQTRDSFSRMLRRLDVELEILQAERVPRSGGLIFMCNQESHLDHLVLGTAIPRPFHSLYNNEVARLPVYGEHLRRTGHIRIDRTNKAQWRTQIAHAGELARSGACILVGPEGTRSWDGELLPMKPGAFMLAAAASVPIVCLTIIGGHQLMPRGSPWIRHGKLRVVFSQPIEVIGAAPEQLADVVASTFRTTKQQHR
jgi:1-acyl-sn-glycerol-3-phosphate acyltransferase